MASLNVEDIDKLLEDLDFGDELDNENTDPDFQIDSEHNTDSEEDCPPSESPQNDEDSEKEIIETIENETQIQ